MVVYGVWVYFRQFENRRQYAVIEGRPVETNGNVDGRELLHDQSAHGGVTRHGDVCYGMLRAAACVDESDHHALMCVRHGQTCL